MSIRPLTFLLSLSLLCCCCATLSAQEYLRKINPKVVLGDTVQIHQVVLLDYSKLVGTLTFADDDIMLIELSGTLEPARIPTDQVRYVGIYTPPGRYRLSSGESLGLTDMTYERTALPYTARRRVKTILLAYSVVEWNLDDHFQIGAGVGGFVGPLLTGRYRTSLAPTVHVGLSAQLLPALLVNGLSSNGPPLLGDLAALATFGNERRFLNLGTGIMFNTDAFGETSVWANRVGVGARIADKWHVYSELLLIHEDDEFFRQLNLFPSVNAAYATRSHRWHFGVFTNFIDEDIIFVPPLPYVGYSYYW